jgi:hypothetical protein
MSAPSYSTDRALTPRLPWSWRIVQVLATIAAGAVLAWVLAHWAWQWWGPAAESAPPAKDDANASAATIAAAPWFGTPRSAPGAPAAFDAGPTLSGDVRLLGVIAERNGEGFALFRFPDRGAVLVRTGEEVANGVRVEAVTPSSVRVRERGAVRELALRPPGGGATSARTSTTAATAAGAASAPNASPAAAPNALAVNRAAPSSARNASAACTPPGGPTQGQLYRLNAELLTGIAGRPDTFSGAFTAASGALVVKEGNGFAGMLGMQPGDRLTHANGVALSGAEDVLVAVIRPLMASQAVRIAGTRDGRHLEWVLVNAGACPA